MRVERCGKRRRKGERRRRLTLRRIVDEPSRTSLSNRRETEVVERFVGSEEDVGLLGGDLER